MEKNLIKKITWGCIILVNIIVATVVFKEFERRSEKFTFNFSKLIIENTGFRLTNYLVSDNTINFKNLINGKDMTIYRISVNEIKKFIINLKCNKDGTMDGYLKRDINLSNENKKILYQFKLNIPISKIFKTFLGKEFSYNDSILINGETLKYKVDYVSICKDQKDWKITLIK